jgi:hypothetical protein
MLRAYVPSVRMGALWLALVAMLATMIAFPGSAGAQVPTRVVVPVTGTLSDGGTFNGRVINPDVSYRSATDTLLISGVLRGTATQSGGDTETVRKEFTTRLSVAQQQDECEILDLDIGRINLDLLGLVVNIAPIHINVTAVPGAGNLLGNLLCALVGLLDDLSGPDLADFLDGLLGALFPRD